MRVDSLAKSTSSYTHWGVQVIVGFNRGKKNVEMLHNFRDTAILQICQKLVHGDFLLPSQCFGQQLMVANGEARDFEHPQNFQDGLTITLELRDL